jgi:quaternary ammonium compound-resistance protein SugE
MSWILLFIAGLLEIAWASGLKASEGFTRVGWSAFTVVTALGSFWLLAMAMRELPLGTAYAVWTGIGVARVGSAALIVVGLVGLKLSSGN